jgi:hypothetical protein
MHRNQLLLLNGQRRNTCDQVLDICLAVGTRMHVLLVCTMHGVLGCMLCSLDIVCINAEILINLHTFLSHNGEVAKLSDKDRHRLPITTVISPDTLCWILVLLQSARENFSGIVLQSCLSPAPRLDWAPR